MLGNGLGYDFGGLKIERFSDFEISQFKVSISFSFFISLAEL